MRIYCLSEEQKLLLESEYQVNWSDQYNTYYLDSTIVETLGDDNWIKSLYQVDVVQSTTQSNI